MATRNLFIKDPNAKLDYLIDWSDWLVSGETIDTFTLTEDAGITVDDGISATSDNDTSVIAWVSGGSAGVTYNVACKIVTSDNRTDERTIKIQVQQR